MSHTRIRVRRPAPARPFRLPSRAARLLAAVAAALLGCVAGAAEARALETEYFVVSNTSDSGPGSLRQAIIDANSTPGLQSIQFAVPGNGTRTIRPLSPLPAITTSIRIDGTTQTGYEAARRPLIELDGTLAGPDASGLRVTGGVLGLHGLAINRFAAHGIRVTAPGRIAAMIGCFIGTDAEGAADMGNGGDGVFLSSAHGGDQYSFIGEEFVLTMGHGSADRYRRKKNVISGNGGNGVRVTGGHRVQIIGSFIGTDVTGSLKLGNSHNGVYFVGGGGTVGVGKTVAASDGTHMGRNVISGNGRNGVLITGTGNEVRVEDNYIGTNAAGDAALGNAMNGVLVAQGPSALIGEGAPNIPEQFRNVISGNGENGIEINGSNVRVEFNYVGTNAAGDAALGNAGHGILLNRPNRSQSPAYNWIGSGGRNVISGNGGDGLRVEGTSTGNLISSNNIGVSADGTAALGNAKNGISIYTSGNHVGNASPSHRNIIGGNGQHGLLVSGNGATGNSFYGNFIGTTDGDTGLNLGNGGDGIRFADGATENRVYPPKNIIAFNGGDGVKVTSGLFGGASRRNRIRDVALYRNGGLGIDLGISGPTPNDGGDADGGSNELQNYPAISVSGGQVTGSLQSKPNRTYAVDVYRAQCGPFGNDTEAGERLFTTSVTTDPGGNAGFAFALPPHFTGAVTASATDPDGNTSELSPPCAAEPGTVSLSADAYGVSEGAGYATITVHYTGTKLTSVNYSATGGTAAAPADYAATSGTLYFGAGFHTLSFNVPVVNDPLDEEDETVTVTLSNVTHGSALGGPATAVLKIADDDGPPSVSVGNVALTEGNGGTKTFTFDVGLNAPSGKPVEVGYATADGAATAGEDYDAASGQLTFQPGQTAGTVSVAVKGDVLNEASENFFVNLSGPVNATPGDTQGLGTIINDDKPPRLFFGGAAYSVGEGAGVATVQVIRADQTAGPLSVKLVSSDGSAASPADFGAVSATLDFADGETTKTFDVQIVDDPAHEADESATLILSDPTGGAVLGNPGAAVLTILDDDEAGSPTLSVDDVATVEGNDGTAKAVFTVSLSAASGQDVSVSYATSDGAAAAGADYVAASDTLTIPAGSTAGQIVVELKGDTEVEPDETFHVNLFGAAGAALNDPQGEGTITNDDAELVAFTSARDGNPEIYVMRTDGSQQARLTDDAGSDRDPAWSPDRRRVAFSSTRNGHADIFVMDADGTGQIALTADAEADAQPAWSPDGARIAFARSASPGYSEIFVMDADGGMLTQLTFTPTPDAHPAWSPDGSKIAFTCGDAANLDVCVLDVVVGAVSKLTTDPADDAQPAWSPDGKLIAFVSARDGDSNIYVMNAGGGDVVRLTYKAGVNRDPAWSADGSGLVFASDRGGAANLEVYKMSADGGGLVKLTSHPAADIEPSWR